MTVSAGERDRPLARIADFGLAFCRRWSILPAHVASFGDVRMTRRKFEITAHMNERDFPHIVELALPPGGFRSQSLEFDAFHRERSNSTSASASPMPPLLMPFRTASAARA